MIMTRRFTFSIQYEHTLSIDQIWPNGNAPHNPTADEIRQAFLNTCYGDVHNGLREWGLTPEASDVVVTDVDSSDIPGRHSEEWLVRFRNYCLNKHRTIALETENELLKEDGVVPMKVSFGARKPE